MLTLEDTDIPNEAFMSTEGITPPVCVAVTAGGITPPAAAGGVSVAARDGAAVGTPDCAAVRTTLGRGDGACGVAAPPGPPGTVAGVSAPVSILLWTDRNFRGQISSIGSQCA